MRDVSVAMAVRVLAASLLGAVPFACHCDPQLVSPRQHRTAWPDSTHAPCTAVCVLGSQQRTVTLPKPYHTAKDFVALSPAQNSTEPLPLVVMLSGYCLPAMQQDEARLGLFASSPRLTNGSPRGRCNSSMLVPWMLTASTTFRSSQRA